MEQLPSLCIARNRSRRDRIRIDSERSGSKNKRRGERSSTQVSVQSADANLGHQAIKVTESTVTSTGVIIVNYERAGAVPTGSL
jgi:hypothetical protein